MVSWGLLMVIIAGTEQGRSIGLDNTDKRHLQDINQVRVTGLAWAGVAYNHGLSRLDLIQKVLCAFVLIQDYASFRATRTYTTAFPLFCSLIWPAFSRWVRASVICSLVSFFRYRVRFL